MHVARLVENLNYITNNENFNVFFISKLIILEIR